MFLTFVSVACVSIPDNTIVHGAAGELPIDSTTIEVYFDGDREAYSHVMLTCVGNEDEYLTSEAGQFNDDGWARLYNTTFEACSRPHFNVWDQYGGNTDSTVLGVTTPEPDLYLWVFANTYPTSSTNGYEEEMFLPVTVEGTYFEGGQPPEPFNSVFGWEYACPVSTTPS